ncbi:MAG: ornithine decarboxylase [Acidimicrobiaceae bacterium]|jgi:ornithine decarboxylase|nr:ornithine decarboxylase [Acidimicrobiaceae bacterium]
MPTAKLHDFLAASEHATPFLVLDLDVVAQRYRQLVSMVPDARVHYAVKANPAQEVVELLVELGSAFDVASPAEIDLCLAAGAEAVDLSFGNTIKKARDIAYAYACGVSTYTVDAREELHKVLTHAPGAEVCVRLFHEGAGADWPLSRKFGCDETEALELLTMAHDAGSATGVSFHVGSQQRDCNAWDLVLDATARLFDAARDRGVSPSFVTLGGGLPGRYRDPVAPLVQYAAAIEAALMASFGTERPRLLVEPGRFLVADAGVLRTEVVLVSQRSLDPRRWVYLDCGRFGGLAETLDEAIRYSMRTAHDDGPFGPVAVAGPTCDSADVLYEKTDYELPLALAAGDHVDLLSAGAYTATYASVGFNGFGPLAQYYI